MNISENLTVNDLPRYSRWPARLLGNEPWEQKHKTPQEITREYENEKWGPFFSKAKEAGSNISLETVDSWLIGNEAIFCSIGEQFELLPPLEAHRKYLDLIDSTLKEYLPASALVELGCGYGSIILALAQRDHLSKMPIIAGEYTASGVNLVSHLATVHNLTVTAGHCNFNLPHITELTIPEGAIIFTSNATPYVPRLAMDFVAALAARKPKVVVHIEPCFEHCDENTLLGLLRKRYIEVNDYNTNLITLLHEAQEQGRIRLVKEEPTVFGENPLLAASILAWTANA